MSRQKTCYVISYHGILCHDMSYVTTIAASLIVIGNSSCHFVKIVIFFSFSFAYSLAQWGAKCEIFEVSIFGCIGVRRLEA